MPWAWPKKRKDRKRNAIHRSCLRPPWGVPGNLLSQALQVGLIQAEIEKPMSHVKEIFQNLSPFIANEVRIFPEVFFFNQITAKAVFKK